MRLLAGLVVMAGLVSAQSFEIRGTVIDPDLNSGIAGAEVTLSLPNGRPTTVPTDAGGAFDLRLDQPGQYYVQAKKSGYSPASRGIAQLDGAFANLTSASPLVEVKLLLTRPGDVTGRVLDPDGKPVPNLRMSVRTATSSSAASDLGATVQRLAMGSQRALVVAASGVTDKDGYFTTETKLPPGDYVVRWTRPWTASNLMTKFSEDDANTVDEDYEELSAPVRVSSGSTASAGSLVLSRRVPYYRARVRVRTEGCAAGEKWKFLVSSEPFSFTDPVRQADIGCTSEFLVRYLKPGSYVFRLSSATRWGVATVEIGRANVEADLALHDPMSLSGRIVAAPDATLPAMSGLKVNSVAPDSEGRFTLTGLMSPDETIFLAGLPSRDYVKEIRYNGAAVPGANLKMSPGTGQQLELVIDDKAASISGTVTDSDQPTPGARVIAVKWPPPTSQDQQPVLASTSTDSSGKFQFAGLTPGEYRMLAVLPGVSVPAADVLVQILNNADRVTLDPGASPNIMVKLTRP